MKKVLVLSVLLLLLPLALAQESVDVMPDTPEEHNDFPYELDDLRQSDADKALPVYTNNGKTYLVHRDEDNNQGYFELQADGTYREVANPTSADYPVTDTSNLGVINNQGIFVQGSKTEHPEEAEAFATSLGQETSGGTLDNKNTDTPADSSSSTPAAPEGCGDGAFCNCGPDGCAPVSGDVTSISADLDYPSWEAAQADCVGCRCTQVGNAVSCDKDVDLGYANQEEATAACPGCSCEEKNGGVVCKPNPKSGVAHNGALGDIANDIDQTFAPDGSCGSPNAVIGTGTQACMNDERLVISNNGDEYEKRNGKWICVKGNCCGADDADKVCEEGGQELLRDPTCVEGKTCSGGGSGPASANSQAKDPILPKGEFASYSECQAASGGFRECELVDPNCDFEREYCLVKVKEDQDFDSGFECRNGGYNCECNGWGTCTRTGFNDEESCSADAYVCERDKKGNYKRQGFKTFDDQATCEDKTGRTCSCNGGTCKATDQMSKAVCENNGMFACEGCDGSGKCERKGFTETGCSPQQNICVEDGNGNYRRLRERCDRATPPTCDSEDYEDYTACMEANGNDATADGICRGHTNYLRPRVFDFGSMVMNSFGRNSYPFIDYGPALEVAIQDMSPWWQAYWRGDSQDALLTYVCLMDENLQGLAGGSLPGSLMQGRVNSPLDSDPSLAGRDDSDNLLLGTAYGGSSYAYLAAEVFELETNAPASDEEDAIPEEDIYYKISFTVQPESCHVKFHVNLKKSNTVRSPFKDGVTGGPKLFNASRGAPISWTPNGGFGDVPPWQLMNSDTDYDEVCFEFLQGANCFSTAASPYATAGPNPPSAMEYCVPIQEATYAGPEPAANPNAAPGEGVEINDNI